MKTNKNTVVKHRFGIHD